MGEIKLAVRSLLKSKLFTAVAIITLAIGIGATTAVYSVFDAIALRPLPFSKPERLVDIEEWSATELCAECGVGVSRPMLADLQENAASFDAIAAYSEIPINVGGRDAAERAGAAMVTGNFFSMLGVRPLHGRTLDAGDDRPGASPVVVVGERYFVRRLGGDPRAIGRALRINDRPVTLVGVMPSSAVLPEFAEFWLPFGQGAAAADRSARDLGVIGRLYDGVTVRIADAELKRIAAIVEKAYPETQKSWTTRVRPLRQAVGDNEISVYGLMMGAVIVLWAIVCANLAGLLLARGIGRRREIAVRLALGADRPAIIWHLLAESLCISVIGGVLGAVAASWTIDGLLASLDTQIPSWLAPRLDPAVLAFCVLLSLASAAAFGLLPAIRASRPSVHDDLKAGSQANVGGGKSALRGSLVAIQLTLALLLLSVSGSLSVTIRSLSARGSANADQVVQARIEVLGDQSAERVEGTVRALVDRLNGLAEAESAAASSSGFIAGFGGEDVRIRVEGVPAIADGVAPRFYFAITPRYFETAGRRVVEGRAFVEGDRAGSNPVVIINRRLGQQLWPGRPALGHRIRLGAADSLPWLTIVGVIADVDTTPGRRIDNLAYVPFSQSPLPAATLLIAARGDPAALLKPVREAAHSVSPGLPLLDLMTMEQAHDRTWRPYRNYALTLSAMGAIALILAAVGLYGVVAYGAEERTREIGVRIALGARRSDVIRLVTRHGIKLAGIGVLCGIVAAAMIMPVMRTMIFGAKPFSAVALGGAAAVLVVVAAVASYLPARRAASTDPVVALRSE